MSCKKCEELENEIEMLMAHREARQVGLIFKNARKKSHRLCQINIIMEKAMKSSYSHFRFEAVMVNSKGERFYTKSKNFSEIEGFLSVNNTDTNGADLV